MADKQIIIDGCDVSGCEFYFYIESNKYPHRCTCYEDMYGCSVVCDITDCCKNCHYKNWKRKEQECDMWKNLTVDNGAVALKYQQQLDQLKAENESLKESFKLISATLNHHLQWEVDVYKRQIDSSVPDDWEYEEVLVLVEEYIEKLKAENDTYKKMFEDEDVQLALTEIRSGERHLWYNKADKLSKTLAEIRDIATCCIEGDVARIRMKQILQKISECEGNDEN